MTPQELVRHIVASQHWQTARNWGEPRPGHPEGTIGAHVEGQLIPFIDRFYREEPEYWDLVALAYLHDISKPVTQYENGRLVGDPHSVISARIATALGAPDRLVQVVLANDRAYSHWRKMLDKKDIWQEKRWTDERKQKFIEEFGRENLDRRLLVLFHRADNCFRRADIRDDAHDHVFWLEHQLVACGLLAELPEAGKDQKLG
jgi:hypothetical protein